MAPAVNVRVNTTTSIDYFIKSLSWKSRYCIICICNIITELCQHKLQCNICNSRLRISVTFFIIYMLMDLFLHGKHTQTCLYRHLLFIQVFHIGKLTLAVKFIVYSCIFGARRYRDWDNLYRTNCIWIGAHQTVSSQQCLTSLSKYP